MAHGVRASVVVQSPCCYLVEYVAHTLIIPWSPPPPRCSCCAQAVVTFLRPKTSVGGPFVARATPRITYVWHAEYCYAVSFFASSYSIWADFEIGMPKGAEKKFLHFSILGHYGFHRKRLLIGDGAQTWPPKKSVLISVYTYKQMLFIERVVLAGRVNVQKIS